MSINSLLKMRCDISRDSNTVANRSSYGSYVADYDSLSTNVNCLIQEMSARDAERYSKIGGLSSTDKYLGFFKSTQDIKKDDKITCITFDPSIMYVKGVHPQFNASSGIVNHLEVVLGIEES